MALTSEQNIPEKPKEKDQPWTFRRLFPFAAMTSAFAKTFITPFEVLLGFNLLIIGVVELVGRHVSWGFYLIAILLLGAAIFERHADLIKPKPETK